MTVYVLTEHGNDSSMVLGVYSTLEAAKAQTTAPWRVAEWLGDKTFYAEDANFHGGIGVDYFLTPYVIDAVSR